MSCKEIVVPQTRDVIRVMAGLVVDERLTGKAQWPVQRCGKMLVMISSLLFLFLLDLHALYCLETESQKGNSPCGEHSSVGYGSLGCPHKQ